MSTGSEEISTNCMTFFLANLWYQEPAVGTLLLTGHKCFIFFTWHMTQHSHLMGVFTTSVLLVDVTENTCMHYNDVIMGAIESQITGLTIVNSVVYSGADQRKHESSASLAFVQGLHRGSMNSLHKWPVTRKMFPFDDVIMCLNFFCRPWYAIWLNAMNTNW